ncbi:MAG: hypothetical protein AAB772_01225 [Patescibacteria group bacterium]
MFEQLSEMQIGLKFKRKPNEEETKFFEEKVKAGLKSIGSSFFRIETTMSKETVEKILSSFDEVKVVYICNHCSGYRSIEEKVRIRVIDGPDRLEWQRWDCVKCNKKGYLDW